MRRYGLRVVPTLPLPRSAVLATWLGLGGELRDLLTAVQGDDEPHTVEHDGTVDTLPDYLTSLAVGTGCDAAGVLPVPGDPAARGPAVAASAIEAGETALLRGPGGCRALVPLIRRFGSELEPGHHVRWFATPVVDWRRAVTSQVGSPEEAARALSTDLLTAASALESLDSSQWWSTAVARLDAVRDAELPSDQLPAGLKPARLRMLTTAARLRAIVALAGADGMVPAGVFLADQRAAALREIDGAARRTITAATTFVAGTD